jgi:hypothetical protein
MITALENGKDSDRRPPYHGISSRFNERNGIFGVFIQYITEACVTTGSNNFGRESVFM